MPNTVEGSPCGADLLLRSADVLCASLNGRGKGAGISLRGTVKSYDWKLLCDFTRSSGGGELLLIELFPWAEVFVLLCHCSESVENFGAGVLWRRATSLLGKIPERLNNPQRWCQQVGRNLTKQLKTY